ncbi:MAG: methionine--tRNA ligase subunit beta [archaeon]
MTEIETISFNEFKKIDLRIGVIKTVEDIEGKDKLLKLKVDLGEKEIQLIAGIKELYSKEELEGKQIVVVCNLQPARIGGQLSEGMLLAAGADNDYALITVDKERKSGTKVE